MNMVLEKASQYSPDQLRVQMDSNVILQVDHLAMRFGGLTALNDVSCTIDRGYITAIIGPNGAGKTTFFNCLTGFYKPTEGMIKIRHNDGKTFLLEQMDDFRISSTAKVVRTFQNIRLFGGMTVLENLVVAQHHVLSKSLGSVFCDILGISKYNIRENQAIDVARYWLDRINLLDNANDLASSLPYGSQRRLEIIRAMCTEPRLLCLDEPAAGLNPRESGELNILLRLIRDEHDVSIMLIEHDMSVVMEISDHIIVLDHGEKISDGTPDFIKSDASVIAAYLGVSEDETQETGVYSNE